MRQTQPRILIVSLAEDWTAIARLPGALKQAGFEVAALCPKNAPLAATRYLDRLIFVQPLPFGRLICRQVTAAINQWQPELLIPGDDATVIFLQGMIGLHLDGKLSLAPLAVETLRRSFGRLDWMVEATSKWRTLERAKKLGLRTPQFACVHSAAEAVRQAEVLDWPVVVKRSTGFSGNQVTFCDHADAVVAAYLQYRAPATHWKSKIKSSLKNGVGWWSGPDWFPADYSVTVNSAIGGQTTVTSLVAASGRVLSHASIIRLHCNPPGIGPSSVVQFISHPGMREAAEKLVSHWGATGFLSFDFVLSATGEANLVECNPRPTFLSYMGAISGADFAVALRQQLAGDEIRGPTPPRHEVVAYFPNEWRRDPHSPYLHDAFHDVPWDDPRLVERLVS